MSQVGHRDRSTGSRSRGSEHRVFVNREHEAAGCHCWRFCARLGYLLLGSKRGTYLF